MNKLYTLLIAFFLVFKISAQHNEENSKSYTLSFDNSQVENWEEFEVFVSSITQSESLELNDQKDEFSILTYRALDPKVIQGKLYKFGVDFIQLKENK